MKFFYQETSVTPKFLNIGGWLLLENLQKGQCVRLRKAIGARVNQLTSNKQAQGPLFRAMYSAISERYKVESYSKLPEGQLLDALRFIEHWEG